MATKTFLNLAVKDLAKTKTFWSRLGFTFDPRFTDENAACMVISDHSYVMLLVEKFFRTFTTKQVADTATTAEAIMAIMVESRQAVDDLARKAFDAGAAKFRPPEDQGFMYGQSFQDPDGHLWEVGFMDESAAPKG
ncbi:MAG: glyoxalase [Spirochaetes bacterium]|nr:glyoxalase [Spirochaetota bacterium]